MKDALGNDIIIGATYGYSQLKSRHVHIVTGTVDKISENMVTLGNVHGRGGLYGEIKYPLTPETRKRSVYGVRLFPVHKN